jgi:hypothetical protein
MLIITRTCVKTSGAAGLVLMASQSMNTQPLPITDMPVSVEPRRKHASALAEQVQAGRS